MHTAVKIGKKAFVFIAGQNGKTSMSVKLLHLAQAGLAKPFAKPTE